MSVVTGGYLSSHTVSTTRAAAGGSPVPTWACRQAKETPRSLCSREEAQEGQSLCVPKPGLSRGPEPGGVGGVQALGVCVWVCACVHGRHEAAGDAQTQSPHPHTQTRCLSQVPRRKPPDAANAAGSRPASRVDLEQGPPCPQGLHTCVCVCVWSCAHVHRGQRTLTRVCLEPAHVSLLRVMYQHPRSSVQRVHPAKGGASLIA